MHAQRIMIFGRPGSGKSTFAHDLAQRLELPLFHIDKFFYLSNWEERPHDEFVALLQAAVDQERWVIDGNALQTLEMRFKRADIVLYFCYPPLHSLFRVVKRLFYKDKRIQDRADGCKELFGWKFIKYIWTFEDRVRELLEQLRRDYPTVVVIKITNDREAAAVYKSLTSENFK